MWCMYIYIWCIYIYGVYIYGIYIYMVYIYMVYIYIYGVYIYMVCIYMVYIYIWYIIWWSNEKNLVHLVKKEKQLVILVIWPSNRVEIGFSLSLLSSRWTECIFGPCFAIGLGIDLVTSVAQMSLISATWLWVKQLESPHVLIGLVWGKIYVRNPFMYPSVMVKPMVSCWCSLKPISDHYPPEKKPGIS